MNSLVPRTVIGRTLAGLAALVLILVAAPHAAGQAEGLAGQSLRGYWHVFLAYALAWLLLLGWLVAVFRRLGRLDREVDPG